MQTDQRENNNSQSPRQKKPVVVRRGTQINNNKSIDSNIEETMIFEELNKARAP